MLEELREIKFWNAVAEIVMNDFCKQVENFKFVEKSKKLSLAAAVTKCELTVRSGKLLRLTYMTSWEEQLHLFLKSCLNAKVNPGP